MDWLRSSRIASDGRCGEARRVQDLEEPRAAANSQSPKRTSPTHRQRQPASGSPGASPRRSGRGGLAADARSSRHPPPRRRSQQRQAERQAQATEANKRPSWQRPAARHRRRRRSHQPTQRGAWHRCTSKSGRPRRRGLQGRIRRAEASTAGISSLERASHGAPTVRRARSAGHPSSGKSACQSGSRKPRAERASSRAAASQPHPSRRHQRRPSGAVPRPAQLHTSKRTVKQNRKPRAGDTPA